MRTLHILHLSICSVLLASLTVHSDNANSEFASEIRESLKDDLVDHWYPHSVDKEMGGFYTLMDVKWDVIRGKQNKFVIPQSRHLWSCSKLAKFYPDNPEFLEYAKQGYEFLRDHLQKPDGGFYWSVTRSGEPVFIDERTAHYLNTYGQSFTIFALAAYADASGDPEALELAKKTFLWLEQHMYDREFGGYVNWENAISDADPEAMFIKGQNTTIHLMEAFAELYRNWKDPLLAKRLKELVRLVSNELQDDRGFTKMFFSRDWTQQTLSNTPEAYEMGINHIENVSFGHDVEIAYLLLDAVDSLGLGERQNMRLMVLDLAEKLVDHSIKYAWDSDLGGLFESGKYVGDQCVVTNPVKTWWVQAENLNALVLLAQNNPEKSAHYQQIAFEQWQFIKKYQIDPKQGGWFEEIMGNEPSDRRPHKAHRWKASYHNVRALINVVHMLEQPADS